MDKDCLALLEAIKNSNGAAMLDTLESSLNKNAVQVAGIVSLVKEYGLVEGVRINSVGVIRFSRAGLARMQEWGML